MPAAPPTVAVSTVLRDIARHPLSLLHHWNWKAAAFSAILRALIFFIANRHGVHHAAVKAMVTELVYATFAAGIAGCVTQRLRHAGPQGRTAFTVWFVLPALMSVAQYGVHRAMGTPHLRGSIIASFLFASFASGFNWFSMRRGAFITGANRPFARDLVLVPKLILQFILSPLRSRPSS